jgi:hypothetical protein
VVVGSLVGKHHRSAHGNREQRGGTRRQQDGAPTEQRQQQKSGNGGQCGAQWFTRLEQGGGSTAIARLHGFGDQAMANRPFPTHANSDQTATYQKHRE